MICCSKIVEEKLKEARMKKMIMAGLVLVCAVVIIASFFSPWVRANVSVTKVAKGLTSTASNKLQNSPFAGKFVKGFDAATNAVGNLGDLEIKTQVSGYDIPTLINKKTSREAISIMQIMVKDTKDLDKKSMLVYLLPIFAIVCIALAAVGLKNKLAIIAIAVISGAISIGGLYNLYTVNLASLPVQVTIMNGLWQTMYGYLSMCIISIAWVVIDK